MKKRILAFLLCVCMIASLLPVIATAEEAATDKPSIRFNYEVPGTSTYVTMNAGDKPTYWKTGNFNTSEPDTFYMAQNGTENDWNVKLEYPVDGIPTMTLKNAKIVEARTICFVGAGANTGSAPFAGDVKLILEGDNYISCTNPYSSDIYFNITGTATIAGPGKLKIEHSLNSAANGIIHSLGSLTLDHANIDIDIPAVASRVCQGVSAENGDLTIKGGSLSVTGFNSLDWASGWTAYRPLSHALRADADANGNGGNLTIEDRANVKIVASCSNSNDDNGRQAAETIYASGKFTLKNSDIEFTTYGGTYLTIFGGSMVPDMDFVYDNGYTILSSASKGYNPADDTITTPTNAKTSTDIANLSFDTIKAMNYLKVTHNCIPGEPVYEGKDCSTIKDKVTYCIACGKEATREPGFTVTPDKAHTPGTPVENVSLRKTVAHDAATDSYPAGYYVMETHCDVCGELIETKNVPFEAGLFYMTTYGNTGGIGETATTKPQIVLNPGQTLYYTTTQAQATADYPNSWYRAAGSADNWNIKLEYPVGGHPIMTLKGATIKNDAGIFYGLGKYICGAPLTVVVQEDSTVASRVLGEATGKYNSYNRALTFRTTADVTITGPGKLTVSSDNHSDDAGNILAYGNLIFENANVELYSNPNDWPANNGIRTKGGNIVIKNTKLLIRCVDTAEDGSPTAYHAALRADADANGERGNITICDGSDVRIFASTYSTQSFVTAGQFTIQDSNVVFASTGKTYSSLFSATSKPVLDFTKSYRVKASTLTGEYNAETGTYTPPEKGYVDFTATTSGLYYFTVQMTGEIEGTSVTLGSTLDVHFAFDKTIIGTDGYVEFVKNGETTKVSLADCEADENFYILTFPGVAAKEMKDTITVTVYDAAGNPVSEVYSDSIAAYAMRMLRGEKPKDHTDEQFAALKTLLVDMLNYGAEAQTFFGHNADQLVNADLTDDEKALASAEMKALTTEERAIEGEGYLATSFILESDIAMLIALDKEVTGTGSYALVTFTDHYGNVTTQKKIAALDTETHTEFRFDGLAAADARYDVTWEIYTAEDAKIATVTDSLEKYIARCIDEYDWMAQIMIYADSAYAYWHFNA